MGKFEDMQNQLSKIERKRVFYNYVVALIGACIFGLCFWAAYYA